MHSDQHLLQAAAVRPAVEVCLVQAVEAVPYLPLGQVAAVQAAVLIHSSWYQFLIY